MQHDPLLRAMVRAVYDACYSSEEWAPVGFEEAERLRTVRYRKSVDAAFQVRSIGLQRGEQLPLFNA